MKPSNGFALITALKKTYVIIVIVAVNAAAIIAYD